MGNKHSSVHIEINPNDHIEKSLRKFKRMCESFGVVKEYKKRQDYKKPSVRNKEKREAALKRRLKPTTKFRTQRRAPAEKPQE